MKICCKGKNFDVDEEKLLFVLQRLCGRYVERKNIKKIMKKLKLYDVVFLRAIEKKMF